MEESLQNWACAKLREGNYTEKQKNELKYSLTRFELTQEQLELLLNPLLDAKQIGELRCALLAEMPLEQVKIFAKPDIEWCSMWELRKCLQQGVDRELVIQMAEASLRDTQIEQIRIAFQEGAPAKYLIAIARQEAIQNGRC